MLIMRIIDFTGITALLVFSAISYADLARMDDKQLGDSTAAGLGFALDDFMLNSDSAVLKVTGINDSTGTEIEVDWSELYIMGEGSESGTNPTTVDIGSYLHPWTISTVRGSADWDGDPSTHHSGEYAAIGDDIALIEINMERYTSAAQNTKNFVDTCLISSDPSCASLAAIRRGGIDIGSKFEFVLPQGSDFLDIDIRGAYMDGTSMRLWSRENVDGDSVLYADLDILFYAKEIDIGVCDSGCNPATSSLNIDNFYLDINFGYGEIQPFIIDVTSDGHFEFELAKPDPEPQGINPNDSDAMIAFYDDFYANAPKSNVYIGNIQVGNNTAGEAIVRDMSIQYLKVTSQDLN
jgi:hypothetical protein|tara:strand:+ start:1809 stop:2861 length:1053 start_codon:yes stop_codon:yes gene_type:complete